MSSLSQYFRAGAGALILNGKGLVLSLERADIPGAWQLPQGGLERSEDPFDTAIREIREETRIVKDDLLFVEKYPHPLAYELPEEAWTKKTGRGQVQYWFLFKFSGSDETIDVTTGGEFRAWKWTAFQDLLHTAVEFRKPVYQQLSDYFQQYLSTE